MSEPDTFKERFYDRIHKELKWEVVGDDDGYVYAIGEVPYKHYTVVVMMSIDTRNSENVTFRIIETKSGLRYGN